MSWTRLDDGWTDRRELSRLSYAARWHLLALVQWCSRTRAYEGVLRPGDARRASDVPDPEAAMEELACAGLIESTDDGDVRVVGIDAHVPPPHMRDEKRKAGQRERKARSRARAAETAGSSTVVTRDMERDVEAESRDVTRDTGTGRDRTGQDERSSGVRVGDDASSSQATVPAVPGRRTCAECGRESEWSFIGGRCRRCMNSATATATARRAS